MNKQRVGVLILHGFASSLDSVNGLEAPLKSLGVPVHIPLLRGHGAKSPEALRGVCWQDWLADAEAALKELLGEVERVIVIGHSMGALVALNLAADHCRSSPGDRWRTAEIAQVILAGAAVQMDSPLAPGRPLYFLAPLARRVIQRWPLPPVYADPSLARNDTNYHWAPMEAIFQFLELSEVTRRRLPEVSVPTLILHSRKDKTAAPESAEIVYQGIATPAAEKRMQWFEVSSHEMFQDCEREAVIGAVVEAVKEILNR